MDGYYHSIIALTRWPKMTHPGLVRRLTNLRLLNYTITVNVDPLPVRQEILKEEKEHDRIAGDYASEKKVSLLTVLEKKQRKIAALARGTRCRFTSNSSCAPGTRPRMACPSRPAPSRTRSTA